MSLSLQMIEFCGKQIEVPEIELCMKAGNWESTVMLAQIGPRGARWKGLPRDFPSYQACHRRVQQWVTDGTFRKILEVLARDLEERGEIDLHECFVEGSFSGAKKGGLGVGKTKRGKGSKLMVVADSHSY